MTTILNCRLNYCCKLRTICNVFEHIRHINKYLHSMNILLFSGKSKTNETSHKICTINNCLASLIKWIWKLFKMILRNTLWRHGPYFINQNSFNSAVVNQCLWFIIICTLRQQGFKSWTTVIYLKQLYEMTITKTIQLWYHKNAFYFHYSTRD